MQASTAAFATTIAGAAMTVEHTVTITLPAGPYSDMSLTVEQLTVDRATVTDMPDGTRLITGYPAAEAGMTLSGLVDQTDASKTIAWLLNPNEPTSPMYRKDAAGAAVTIKTGLWLPGRAAPELFTIFTGSVDDYTVDPEAGTVQITALDGRDRLIGAPAVPSVFDDGTEGVPVLYSQFALDYMLRARGIRSWPAQRASCSFAAGLRGAFWAERGTFVSYSPTSSIVSPGFINDPAGYGMGMAGFASYSLSPAITGASTPVFCEFWCDTPTGAAGFATAVNVGDPGGVLFTFQQDGTTMSVILQPDNTGLNNTLLSVAIPWAPGYHGYQVAWSGTIAQLTVRRGGVTASGSTATPVARPAATLATVTMQPDEGASVSGVIDSVQITTEASGSSSWNDTFVPGAVLGYSLNAINVIPDLSGSDVWAVIQAIAEAEQAIGGFDELGVFRFLNRNVINAASPVRSITPTYSLKTLQQQVGLSLIRNHIQVPINAVQVQPFSTVWAVSDAVVIGSGGTYTAVVSTDQPVVGLATTTGLIPSGGLVNTSGYRAAQHPDATTPVTNLVMTVTQQTSTQILVTVVNPNGFPVYLITPSGAGYPAGSIGQPALALGGRFAPAAALAPDLSTVQTSTGLVADAQWPPRSEGGAAANPRGELLLPVPSNPWVQTESLAVFLANNLLSDLSRPFPLWRNVSIVPDPRLQLADRVSINDPVTSKVVDDGRIFGVHMTASATDWSMNLDLRALSTPGGWLLGVAGRGELGVNTYV